MNNCRSIVKIGGGFGIYLDSSWEEVRQNDFEQFKRLQHARLDIELELIEKEFNSQKKPK